jgi:NAD(P)-dependent dehydrogenase (short-subunit alcohol dehydrogenase family)
MIGFVRDLVIAWPTTASPSAPSRTPIDTELAGTVLRAMKQQGLDYSAFRTVPRLRLSSPREVADALLYLRPDEVSCIMGTALDASEGR